MSQYELGEKIGRGGMGVVYRAHHLGLRRDVAVKFIHAHLMEDADAEEAVNRFLQEAMLVAQIDHPSVVRVFDTGRDDDGRPYIVMELLEGESLKDRLKRGPIPEAEALNIARQVLSALIEAHKLGIVHRDIKPGNIFLTKNGRVKLLDFGVAKALGGARLTSTGGMVGTAEYMSPEQAQGLPVDARSDLYGLGIVVYEMLTGQPPFQSDVQHAVIQMQINKRMPLLPETVSAGTRGWIGRLTQKPVGSRFASASEALQVAERLSGLADDEGVTYARRDPSVQPVQREPVGSPISTPHQQSDVLPMAEVQQRAVLPDRSRTKRAGLVFAVLVLAIGFGSAAVVINQHAEVERNKKKAEQDLTNVQNQKQQELNNRLANPISIAESGVSLEDPDQGEFKKYTHLGSCRRFFIYAVLTNNLSGIDDQDVTYRVALRMPDTPIQYGAWHQIHVSKGQEQCIVHDAWSQDIQDFEPGKYTYGIEVNKLLSTPDTVEIP